MISKGLLRLKNRLDYFLLDCEISDVLTMNKEKIAGEGNKIFLQVSANRHSLLNGRKNSAGSRTIVVNHLHKTILSAFIKDMYEEVIEYMTYLLKEAAINGADVNRLVGETRVTFEGNEILMQKRREDIVQLVVSQIVRSIDQKKEKLGVIQKTNNKLGLNVSAKTLNKAMPYLLLRHILVHSDGKPEKNYQNIYQLDNKGKVDLTLEYIQQAYQAIYDMAQEFDKAMMDRHYISKGEISSVNA